MSAVVIKQVYCTCDVNGPGCHKVYGKENPKETIGELRRNASTEGWHHIKVDDQDKAEHDICPVCWAARQSKRGFSGGVPCHKLAKQKY